MSILRSCLTGVAASFLAAASLVGGTACSGAHGSSAPPATAASMSSRTANGGQAGSGQSTASPSSAPPAAPSLAGGPGNGLGEGGSDAELVVSRDIVARCPTLRVIKAHVDEFDPNTVWLAVLESIAECMGESGPMAAQSLGVSGDEEHRHVVREVLGSRGVAPTRVVATPPAAGAAECQGGVDCGKRVQLTIIP